MVTGDAGKGIWVPHSPNEGKRGVDVTKIGGYTYDMELDEYGPIGPSIGVALDGPMRHRGKVFWSKADGSVTCGLWEVDAGRFSCAFDGEGEMVHVVKGAIIATADSGEVIELGEGDIYTFTPGWTGIWEMPQPMRKFFTTFTE
jgi:uncharacterized cupin superfamily protein